MKPPAAVRAAPSRPSPARGQVEPLSCFGALLVVWVSSRRCPPAVDTSLFGVLVTGTSSCGVLVGVPAVVVVGTVGVGVLPTCDVPVGAEGVVAEVDAEAVAVPVAVDDAAAVACSVAVGDAVNVAVAGAATVAVAEGVGVAEAGASAVAVAVAVGVAGVVAVGVGVSVDVGVGDGVLVLVGVGGGSVAVAVGDGVFVGGAVAVAVGGGVFVGGACSTLIDSVGPPALAVIVPAPVTEQTANARLPASS